MKLIEMKVILCDGGKQSISWGGGGGGCHMRESGMLERPCSLAVWLNSSVGRASHRYCRGPSSNPVEALNFFQAFFLCNFFNCNSTMRIISLLYISLQFKII